MTKNQKSLSNQKSADIFGSPLMAQDSTRLPFCCFRGVQHGHAAERPVGLRPNERDDTLFRHGPAVFSRPGSPTICEDTNARTHTRVPTPARRGIRKKNVGCCFVDEETGHL